MAEKTKEKKLLLPKTCVNKMTWKIEKTQMKQKNKDL